MIEWFEDHSLVLIFIVLYLAILVYHAWHGHRRSQSLGDYLVAGRSLSGMLVALSFYATFVSSVTFVGHAGRSFTLGPSWWLVCVVVFPLMVFISWFIVAPPFMKKASQYDALTIPEFLGRHYDSMALRRLAGLVVVAASIAYMVAVYTGATLILRSLLELPEVVVLAGIFVVVTAYTLAGGFHSVVATDTVQGLILFVGGIMLPLSMIMQKGGLGPLLASVHEANPDALAWSSGAEVFTMVGLALGVGLKFVVEPRQLSRFYGLSSNDQLRRGRWLAPTFMFFTYLFMLPVGMLAHAFISGDVADSFRDDKGILQTKEVIPYLLGPEVNMLGPVFSALFVTGLVAVAMSSLDSVLLVAASSMDHDLIAPERDQVAAMNHTRLWVVVLSAIAAILVLVLTQGIVEMSALSGSIYAGCFLPALILGLFWSGGTRVGALASLVTGFVVTLVWFLAKKHLHGGAYAGLHEVYVGSLVSIGAFFVISMLTRTRPAQGTSD